MFNFFEMFKLLRSNSNLRIIYLFRYVKKKCIIRCILKHSMSLLCPNCRSPLAESPELWIGALRKALVPNGTGYKSIDSVNCKPISTSTSTSTSKSTSTKATTQLVGWEGVKGQGEGAWHSNY